MPRAVALAIALPISLAIAVGVLLRWPALDGGFREDDFVHMAVLDGAFPIERSPWDLFWFAGRNDAENRALRDAGHLPWWSADDLRMSMLRPLASALVAFDHAFLGFDARLHHAHSFLWFAALIASAGLLFARLLPPETAAAAVLLYALDESHAVPVAWLANRSSLVATTFAFAAAWAHLRWREDHWRPGAWLAALAAALAMCAGEYALGALALVPAYELTHTRERLAARLAAIVPVAAPVGVYVAARRALGYGMRDSGLYVDPSELGRFTHVAIERVPALAADLVLGVPAQWWNSGFPWREQVLALGVFTPARWRALPDWHTWQVALGVGGLAVGAWLALATRRTAPELWPRIRFLALGSGFALLPGAGSLPSSRLLHGAALGAAALFATVAVTGWRAWRAGRGPRGRAVALVVFVVGTHGLLAAERAWAHATRVRPYSEAAVRYVLDAEIPHEGTSELDVYVVSAADFTTAAHVPWVLRAQGREAPRSFRRLSGAARAHDLVRVADDAFDLEVLAEDVGPAAAGSLYRAADKWIVEGSRYSQRGLRVDVLEARRGNPARMRFTFDASLDDPTRTLFLVARPDGLKRLNLPAIGEGVRLPAAAPPPVGVLP